MDLAKRFKEFVGEELRKCKEVGLANLQADTTVGDTMSQSKDILRNTKREMIMLPRFSIDERTAYLKYPVGLQHCRLRGKVLIYSFIKPPGKQSVE